MKLSLKELRYLNKLVKRDLGNINPKEGVKFTIDVMNKINTEIHDVEKHIEKG